MAVVDLSVTDNRHDHRIANPFGYGTDAGWRTIELIRMRHSQGLERLFPFYLDGGYLAA